MICTTAISNIDSTLENFKNEVEREEFVAFMPNLWLAIAKFAAVDNSPTPPQFPSHTCPNKSGAYGSGNGKNGLNEIAITIP